MSNEGQQPPSIAPKRPPASGGVQGGGGLGTAEDGTRSASGTSSPAAGSGPGSNGPSVTDRVKKAAGSAAGAARNALPTKTDAPPSSTDRGGDRPGDRPGERPAERQGAGTATGASSSAAPASSGGPRRVRLAVARVDPWSIMKLSFLLSVAVGIMIVVATAVVWYTLDGMAVFTRVNDVIATLASDPTFFDLEEYAAFDRVISLATMVAVVDIVLLTALATIGAFLYNITAALVGGINLTLTDD